MAEPIIVVGHKNPDNDSICAAVGYAYLKNELTRRDDLINEDGTPVRYEPARLGPLPLESAWVLEATGLEEPRLIEDVCSLPGAPKQRVVMVDHNEVRQSVAGLDGAEVVEIIDHHRIGGIVTANPILFMNVPVGSTATIVATEFDRHGVEITAAIAKLLLSAILTDTVILKSPTATDVDRAMVERLAAVAGVEPIEFGLEVFRYRGGEEDVAIEKFVTADSKEFQMGDITVLIGQHETVDLQAALQREDEARKHMRQLKDENGYEFVLLMLTDILAEGSQLICEGNSGIVDAVFGPECAAQGGKWMPGVLSRKKQVAGPILGS